MRGLSPSALMGGPVHQSFSVGGGLAGFSCQHGRNHSREVLQPFGGPKVRERKSIDLFVP